MDALAGAVAVAIVVINLTAAAVISVNAFILSGSIVAAAMLTTGAVCLWVRLLRRQSRHTELSPEVHEFVREVDAFRARMAEFRQRTAVRDQRYRMCDEYDPCSPRAGMNQRRRWTVLMMKTVPRARG